MKRTLLMYSIALCLFASCESDPQWKTKTLVFVDSFAPSWNTAEVTMTIDEQSNTLLHQIELVYSLSEDFAAEKTALMTRNSLGGWNVQLTNLKDSCSYFVRYRFIPAYLQPETNSTSSFRTLPLPAPIVQTNEATDITATSAILHASAQNAVTGDIISERGFYYSLLREGEYERKQVKCGSGEGVYEARIEALWANATYYFVAYAINRHGIAYGDTLKFETLNPYK